MKSLFEKATKAEPGRKAFFVSITPPIGPTFWGIRHAGSVEEARLDVMKMTGLKKQEIAGRVSAFPLYPPAGMEYRATPFTITSKSKEDFLKVFLGRVL